MTKKVNGYMINRGGWIEFDQAPDDDGPWVPCTMVIADKAHERTFTESEVRVILRDLLAASEDGPCIPNYDRMDEAVKLHGLSFDPL